MFASSRPGIAQGAPGFLHSDRPQGSGLSGQKPSYDIHLSILFDRPGLFEHCQASVDITCLDSDCESL